MTPVIFHVDELDRWGMVLNNAKNYRALRPTSPIIILANGNAVLFYVTNNTALDAARETLIHQAIQFEACHNALKSYAIEATSLPSYVHVVASGVVELADRQAEGYAYIRP